MIVSIFFRSFIVFMRYSSRLAVAVTAYTLHTRVIFILRFSGCLQLTHQIECIECTNYKHVGTKIFLLKNEHEQNEFSFNSSDSIAQNIHKHRLNRTTTSATTTAVFLFVILFFIQLVYVIIIVLWFIFERFDGCEMKMKNFIKYRKRVWTHRKRGWIESTEKARRKIEKNTQSPQGVNEILQQKFKWAFDA